jgi:hypothetical protein
LSEAGARSLLQVGVAAVTGKDMVRSVSTSHFRHRCIANELAVGAIVEGFRVSTEREVAQGRWIGEARGIAGKKPDVLLRDGSSVWWIEVERSRKNAKDYSRLLQWVCAIGRDTLLQGRPSLLGEEMRLARVVFVCTPSFQRKLSQDLETAGWKKNDVNALISFETSLYSLEGTSFHHRGKVGGSGRYRSKSF